MHIFQITLSTVGTASPVGVQTMTTRKESIFFLIYQSTMFFPYFTCREMLTKKAINYVIINFIFFFGLIYLGQKHISYLTLYFYLSFRCEFERKVFQSIGFLNEHSLLHLFFKIETLLAGNVFTFGRCSHIVS